MGFAEGYLWGLQQRELKARSALAQRMKEMEMSLEQEREKRLAGYETETLGLQRQQLEENVKLRKATEQDTFIKTALEALKPQIRPDGSVIEPSPGLSQTLIQAGKARGLDTSFLEGNAPQTALQPTLQTGQPSTTPTAQPSVPGPPAPSPGGLFTVSRPDLTKDPEITNLIGTLPGGMQNQARTMVAAFKGDRKAALTELTRMANQANQNEALLQREETLARFNAQLKLQIEKAKETNDAGVWTSLIKQNPQVKLSDVPSALRTGVARQLAQEKYLLPVKLSPQAQKEVSGSNAMVSSIDRMMEILDPIKDNNQMAFFLGPRSKYALGVKTPYSQLIDFGERGAFMQVKALFTGRVAYQIMEKMLQHTPHFYKDSPALVYQKLEDMKTTIQEQVDAETGGVEVIGGQYFRRNPVGGEPEVDDVINQILSLKKARK